MRSEIKICLLLFALLTCTNSEAQRPGIPNIEGLGDNTPNYSQGRDSTGFQPPLDTANVKYFHDNEFQVYEIIDTMDHIQRYNPVFTQEFGYYHLGNFGSPHRQLVYQPRVRKGIDMGFHHYDLYTKKADDIRFYNTASPHTDFMYTAGSQENALVKATFTQNINSRINLGVDYGRIIHAGGYQNQRVRHTNLGLSGWYKSENDLYYGLVSWAGNRIKQQNNGGIFNEADLLDEDYIGERDLIPVTLGETAQTEYDYDEFTYSHYLNLWRKADKKIEPKVPELDTLPKRRRVKTSGRNIRTPRPGVGLSHRFRYQKEQLKFFDTDPTPISAPDFYGIFKTNEIGLRHFINIRKIENRFGAFLYIGKNEAFSFKPALSHAFVFINQEPEEYLLQELRVSAELSTSILNVFDVKADGYYELGTNLGDYLLRGKAGLQVGKLGKLEGQLLQHQYSPNLLQRKLFVSQEQVWETDFKKTNETNLRIQYSLPNIQLSKTSRFQLKGGIQNHLINNLIYYDTLAMPIQATELKNIFQIFIEGNVSLWKLHLENRFVFQQSDLVGLRLPGFWSQHSAFFQGNLFKGAALMKLGADVRMNTSFRGDNWQIVTGQFFNQDFVNQGVYPIVDVFADFKVNRFEAFVKMENISQAILQRTLIVAPNYPTRDMNFRFGIFWTFID